MVGVGRAGVVRALIARKSDWRRFAFCCDYNKQRCLQEHRLFRLLRCLVLEPFVIISNTTTFVVFCAFCLVKVNNPQRRKL